MNCNVLKFFSQNIRKNKLIINTILETQSLYDIIFIQELPWLIICSIPSSSNCDGEPLVGVLHHPNWYTFTRNLTNQSNSPRVITYINICILHFCFSLWNDILNHRDISWISFLNQGSIYFMLNVYSDSSQLALKYLKDTKASIYNVIIMTGDFNIRDSRWDPSYSFHSIHSDSLFDISDSFSLNISNPIENVSTRYSDNDHNANSVLDLVFLCPSFPEFNQHCIHSDWRMSSDHAPITIEVSICEERISLSWRSLAKGSNEEKQFIKDIILIIKNLNTSFILNAETLEEVVHRLASKVEESWQRNLKAVKITRHSKAWWNDECQLSLDKYWAYQSLENWCSFKITIKKTKCLFFNDKVEEITNKKCSLWELMN